MQLTSLTLGLWEVTSLVKEDLFRVVRNNSKHLSTLDLNLLHTSYYFDLVDLITSQCSVISILRLVGDILHGSEDLSQSERLLNNLFNRNGSAQFDRWLELLIDVGELYFHYTKQESALKPGLSNTKGDEKGAMTIECYADDPVTWNMTSLFKNIKQLHSLSLGNCCPLNSTLWQLIATQNSLLSKLCVGYNGHTFTCDCLKHIINCCEIT